MTRPFLTGSPLSIIIPAAAALLLSSGSLTAADWNTYHGSFSLEGKAEADLTTGLEERWRFPTGGPVIGTPVGSSGALYAATERGVVYALDGRGREIWKSRLSGGGERELFTAPPLFTGDALVLGSRLGILYALETATGALRWRYDVGGPVFGTANVVAGDKKSGRSVIVLSQTDGTAHRVDLASGKRVLTSQPTNRCDGAAAVGENVIAYGNCDAALYLLSAGDLQVRRKIELLPDGQVFAGVALAGGRIYAGDRSGRIYGADLATGRILWVNEEGRGDISSTPAVAGGRVIAASDDGTVAALDGETGLTIWRTTLGGRPKEPVVTGGGLIVVSADGALHLLKIDDGSTLWKREVSDEITSPAVIAGRVVVGTDDGFVVSFGAPEGEGASP